VLRQLSAVALPLTMTIRDGADRQADHLDPGITDAILKCGAQLGVASAPAGPGQIMQRDGLPSGSSCGQESIPESMVVRLTKTLHVPDETAWKIVQNAKPHDSLGLVPDRRETNALALRVFLEIHRLCDAHRTRLRFETMEMRNTASSIKRGRAKLNLSQGMGSSLPTCSGEGCDEIAMDWSPPLF
jgi:hypothetical protein